MEESIIDASMREENQLSRFDSSRKRESLATRDTQTMNANDKLNHFNFSLQVQHFITALVTRPGSRAFGFDSHLRLIRAKREATKSLFEKNPAHHYYIPQ